MWTPIQQLLVGPMCMHSVALTCTSFKCQILYKVIIIVLHSKTLKKLGSTL